MKVNKILETMDYGTAPESSAAALKWIEERGADFGLFIDGAFVKPAGRESFATKTQQTMSCWPSSARHRQLMWMPQSVQREAHRRIGNRWEDQHALNISTP